jgi:hypothetical protein
VVLFDGCVDVDVAWRERGSGKVGGEFDLMKSQMDNHKQEHKNKTATNQQQRRQTKRASLTSTLLN